MSSGALSGRAEAGIAGTKLIILESREGLGRRPEKAKDAKGQKRREELPRVQEHRKEGTEPL